MTLRTLQALADSICSELNRRQCETRKPGGLSCLGRQREQGIAHPSYNPMRLCGECEAQWAAERLTALLGLLAGEAGEEPVRLDRVRQVRAEIARDPKGYVDRNLGAAVDRLLDEGTP